MNLKQLRYAVEVERTGSITQAAKNLYAAQPNLSRSVRELEEELGVPLFSRTARGMEPTGEGARFLARAREILALFDQLQDLYRPDTDTPVPLRVVVPRVYFSPALRALLESPECALLLDFTCGVRDAAAAIQEVAAGSARIAVIRYPVDHQEEYLSQLRAARIPHLPLREVPYQLTVHQSHPLAGLEELPFPLPEYYTALLCENDLPFSPVPRKPLRTGPFRTVTLQDTALLLELLGQLQGAYTLTVPLPQDLLRRRQLVQRPCPAAGKLREEVIYRGLESLSPEEQLFLRLVQLQP